MYRPKYFKGHELFDPQTHAAVGTALGANIYSIFDDRLLLTADLLRERFGKMLVNTWAWNGSNQYRGYRPPDCMVGATYSQHRFGRALDMVPIDISSEEIRQDIIAQPNAATYRHITAIELEITWLHFDVRNHDKDNLGLLMFKP